MNKKNEDLLQPVLSTVDNKIPIFSVRACFLTAFFGGPVAIILFSATNSYKLKRLKDDLIFYLLGAVILSLYLYIILDVPEQADITNWMIKQRKENLFYKYGGRVLALFFFFGYNYMHKHYHKALEIFAIPTPNPWKAAIICVVLGGGIQFILAMIVLIIRGVI